MIRWWRDSVDWEGAVYAGWAYSSAEVVAQWRVDATYIEVEQIVGIAACEPDRNKLKGALRDSHLHVRY